MQTRLDALRQLLATPRDHQDMAKIGRVTKWARPDGREKLSHVFKVLRSVTRRAS